MKNTVFQRIWLSGFVFQSLIIGGGYATGRELVEFFLKQGPMGGLLGMGVATLVFSLIAALSFELARLTRSFTYRGFFRHLLGRAWFLFEIGYFALALLVLAVVGAAAGEIVHEHTALRGSVGTGVLMLIIGVLVFRGTALIERVLAGWSFLLYATYALFVTVYLAEFGGELEVAFAGADAGAGWFSGGLRYAGYSIVIVPLVLFCTRHMESRRDAITAGILAGPIAMLPAVLFFVAMSASYPEILGQPVPADFMIRRLDFTWISALFYVVIFGTFVETGTGMIHAINERVAEVFVERERTMPRWMRPAIAIGALILSITLADRIGLVDLIARGYGSLTYYFMLVFLLPLLTIGVWRIAGGGRAISPPAGEAADEA